jgi:glycosyltransferase involved in cell wall biosynthesis
VGRVGGAARPDILVVTIEGTTGWGSAARELIAAFRRAGANVESVGTGPLPQVRTFMLTDLVAARAARRAAKRGIAQHKPAAVVYCSITAALLWPAPGAIWVDTVSAENRPGRHGIWQRAVERRRLAAAPLVLVMSERALAPLSGRPDVHTELVPVPVQPSGPPGERDIAAVTYAGNPEKKRLDHILAAWSRARRADETLVVAGIDGLVPADGLQLAGRLAPDEYRALLRRARAFVAAPTREDYGIAPLEALADGCQLVTTPSPGPYPALDLARRLDPRLVGGDLAAAIRVALDDPSPGYARRASELIAPFSREAVDEVVKERVLPRLVPR